MVGSGESVKRTAFLAPAASKELRLPELFVLSDAPRLPPPVRAEKLSESLCLVTRAMTGLLVWRCDVLDEVEVVADDDDEITLPGVGEDEENRLSLTNEDDAEAGAVAGGVGRSEFEGFFSEGLRGGSAMGFESRGRGWRS